jgi:hypothetical protein
MEQLGEENDAKGGHCEWPDTDLGWTGMSGQWQLLGTVSVKWSDAAQ